MAQLVKEKQKLRISVLMKIQTLKTFCRKKQTFGIHKQSNHYSDYYVLLTPMMKLIWII